MWRPVRFLSPSFRSGNKDNVEQKQKKLAHKSVQTGEAVVTAADLTADDEPSADYWKVLAEKRGNDLNDSLQENERLKDQVKALEDENQICKEMIEESKTLIEVLQVCIKYWLVCLFQHLDLILSERYSTDITM